MPTYTIPCSSITHLLMISYFPETQCLWSLVQEFPPYKFRRNPIKGLDQKEILWQFFFQINGLDRGASLISPSASENQQSQHKKLGEHGSKWNHQMACWQLWMTGWFVVGNQATCSAWHDGSGIHTLYNIRLYDHEFAYAWTVSLDDHGLL